MTADLLVIVPTRGRRVLLERFLGAAAETRQAATDLLVVTDDDDAGTYAGVTLPAATRMVSGPQAWLGPKLNQHAVPAAQAYPVVGFLADDVVPETPGWDALLLAALGTPGIAYGEDRRRTDVPEHPFVSSAIISALGWFCEPSLHHYYFDDIWAALGNAAGCLRFVPHAVIRHLHHSCHPPATRDATYAGAEVDGPHDQAAYQAWRQERMAADVATVRNAAFPDGLTAGTAHTGQMTTPQRRRHVMAQGTILMARTSAIFDHDGQRVVISQGRTTVREGHPILAGHEDLFEPLVPTFEVRQEPAKPARGKAAGSAADG